MSFDVDVALRRGGRDIYGVVRTSSTATVLFGPSGAGKTSILSAIAGLIRPVAGHVRVTGRTLFEAGRIDLPPERRRVGYVFQDARLFPHLTVRENLLYGASDATDLAATAALLDIEPLLDRWPRALSGGEARRVAIGRALMSDPDFLLLDEPTASLDGRRAGEVLQIVERLRDEARLPILLVTHDARDAARIGEVVAIGD